MSHTVNGSGSALRSAWGNDREVQSFHVAGSKSRVEAWSVIRFPFEPKEDLLDIRNEIRQCLHVMEMPAGEVLHAVCRSMCEDLVDTENVLFYNVGMSHCAHLTKAGIQFDREVGPLATTTAALPFAASGGHWRRKQQDDLPPSGATERRSRTAAVVLPTPAVGDHLLIMKALTASQGVVGLSY